MDQKSGCDLAEDLWFKVSHEVAVVLSSGAAASSKGSTRQGESIFKPTHVGFFAGLSPLSYVSHQHCLMT